MTTVVDRRAGGVRTRTWIAGLLLFTIVTHLPTLLFPQPIDDEAIYSVVANEIVHGGLPYVNAIERKPPLLFWVYAGVFRTAGEYNWIALHSVAIVWVLLTMAALFVLGRRLFDDDRPGLVAALLYSLYQPWGIWRNLAFNGEVLMLLPVTWAFAVSLGPALNRRRLELVLAGSLVAAGFLLKQPGAIAAVPLGLFLLHPAYRRTRGYAPIASIVQSALLTCGFVGTLGAVALLLLRQGILQEAYFWSITHHKLSHVFWNRAAENSAAFAAVAAPLLVAAFIGMRARFWRGREAERFAVLTWLAVSALGVAAGERFYPQYYIQLLPPLALLAAPALSALWTGVASWRRMTPRITQWALAVTALAFLVANSVGLREHQRGSDVGAYLRAHAPADSRMFVWGQGTRIYLDAHLRPATRYVATFPLTGYLFGPDIGIDTHDRIVSGAWDNFVHDVTVHPPDFIVDDEVDANHRYPIRSFPEMARLLDGYHIVETLPDAVVYARGGGFGAPRTIW